MVLGDVKVRAKNEKAPPLLAVIVELVILSIEKIPRPERLKRTLGSRSGTNIVQDRIDRRVDRIGESVRERQCKQVPGTVHLGRTDRCTGQARRWSRNTASRYRAYITENSALGFLGRDGACSSWRDFIQVISFV